MKLAALAILVTLAFAGCTDNSNLRQAEQQPESVVAGNERWACLYLYGPGGTTVGQYHQLRNVDRKIGRVRWDNWQGQHFYYIGSYLITEAPCQS